MWSKTKETTENQIIKICANEDQISIELQPYTSAPVNHDIFCHDSNIDIYYKFNSLTLYWLAESVPWIFEISSGDVITADYTIIMSRTLRVTGYHVVYDHSAWFLRMPSSHTLCCLLSVKKQKHDPLFFVQCLIKQLLDSVFVISRIIKVSVRVINLSLRLQLITPTSTLIILDITETSSNNCLLNVGMCFMFPALSR